MARSLFLILFFSIISSLSSPVFLAADPVIEVRQPDFHAVNTVTEEQKPELAAPVTITKQAAPRPNNPAATKTTVAPAPATASHPINYTVSYYANSANEYINTVANLSYSGLYKFRKMIYGHNTGNLLGSLSSQNIGDEFTITENGIIQAYQVKNIAYYRKTPDGALENNPGLMNNIANTALGYDVALLTCAGTSYGNGDASHRLVVFANAI